MSRQNYDQVLISCQKAVQFGHYVENTRLKTGRLFVGKVRDVYTVGDYTLIVTTDRQSAFDRLLACVPFKGQVLNLVSAFWFEATRHIVPNHLVEIPHPSLLIAHRCKPFLAEIVIRSYMTGTTSTSIWTHYQQGSRLYCGHTLPEGMKKNEKLPYVMLTPSTKDDLHDRPISAAEVVSLGLMTQSEWDYVAEKALALFEFGQKQAASNGLILVDTKLEFGRCIKTNEIMLIDEVFTPDSSRYWLASSYEQRMAEGKEPENIDKEFLRIWFRNNCDPYKDAVLPSAPPELVAELSKRYIMLYETITGKRLDIVDNAIAGIGSTSLLEEMSHSAEGFFPPAALIVCVFRDASSPASSAATVDLDHALNGMSYSTSKPVKTNAAIEEVHIDLFKSPTVAAATCKRKADVAVVIASGVLSPAVAEFVATQSSLPTILLKESSLETSSVLVASNTDTVTRFIRAAFLYLDNN